MTITNTYPLIKNPMSETIARGIPKPNDSIT